MLEWAEDSIGEQVTQGGKQTHLGAVDVKEKKNKMKAIGQHDLAAFSWTPMIGPQIFIFYVFILCTSHI